MYVVAADLKLWKEYPLPPRLVSESTISTIYEPINVTPYILVFYNFPANMQQIERKYLYIFNYEAHGNDDSLGLTPAFGQ